MKQKLTVLMLAACIATAAGFAQSAAQLLEKGIFAQETEGNLDNAIAIYRQLINGNPTQRELGAQAQYRLAQALLQKGDVVGASQEFDGLSRDYSDDAILISSLATLSSRRP